MHPHLEVELYLAAAAAMKTLNCLFPHVLSSIFAGGIIGSTYQLSCI